LENESFIRRICLSDATDYPHICTDCDTIAKIFKLNQKAGFISSELQKNEQKKTNSLFSSAAKILKRKKLQNTLDHLETKCNELTPEYSESVIRLISIVASNHNINFNSLLGYEYELLQRGLVKAATNTSVEEPETEI